MHKHSSRLQLLAAAAAVRIEESIVAVREEACAIAARAAGIRSLGRAQSAIDRSAEEGSSPGGCVRRDFRKCWHGRDRDPSDQAWSARHSMCRTPVLYSRVNPRTTKFHSRWRRGRGELAELVDMFLKRAGVVR